MGRSDILRPYTEKRKAPASEGGRYTRETPPEDSSKREYRTSGSVAGVDADVFGGEVAGPVAGGGSARVHIHHQ